MTSEKIFEQGAWIATRDPVNFWTLTAISSKTAEDANFKFGTRAAMGSLEMNPQNFFSKGGHSQGHVTP